MGCQCVREEIKSQKLTQLTLHELYYPTKSKRSTVINKSKKDLVSTLNFTYDNKSDNAIDTHNNNLKIGKSRANQKFNIEELNNFKDKNNNDISNRITILQTNDNQDTLELKNTELIKFDNIYLNDKEKASNNNAEKVENSNINNINEKNSPIQVFKSPVREQDSASNIKIIFNEKSSNIDTIIINKINDNISEIEVARNGKIETNNDLKTENNRLTYSNSNNKKNVERITIHPNNIHNYTETSKGNAKKVLKEIDFKCNA
jgi:hypothetical protein